MARADTYHHGDLRRVVLEAAVELIATQGIEAVSLRELARRADVSHTAPAHHFGDRAGLFTAIAIDGNELLAEALGAGGEGVVPLEEQGVRYVEFAQQHPAHFEVMYRPDLLHRDDPDLRVAQARTRELLQAGVAEVATSRRGRGNDQDAALAAWSLAHGFASLRRTGSLDRFLQDRTAAEAFRAAASHLFAD